MIMGPKAFLMIALTASGIAAGALLLGSCSPSCGRPKVPVQGVLGTAPAPPPPATATVPVHSEKPGRRTLFEKNADRAECKTNPALCDADFFEMDIKKEMKMDLDSHDGASTGFCAGGCGKKSVLQWRLDW